MNPMTRPELVFFRHPGLPGGDGAPPMKSYWELAWPLDPIVKKLYMGEVRRPGIVVSVPPFPPGWAYGRYLDILPTSPGGQEWVEVTDNVTVDRQRGLDACPDRLRERYLFTAIAAIAMPAASSLARGEVELVGPSILQQAVAYWFDKELESAIAGSKERDVRTRYWNILVNVPHALEHHVRGCTLDGCAICHVARECREATNA